MLPINVDYVSIDDLKPNPQNARKHSEKQVKQLENSIIQFGYLSPALINQENQIIAGHGRWLAAKRVGMKTIPVIRIEHLTEAEMRAYMIADNKLTDNSEWDKELLAEHFKELSALEFDFSLDITGFEMPQIDFMLQDNLIEADQDDNIETEESAPIVTRRGDTWILGDHKIRCGNALIKEDYVELMGDEMADVVFSDPPYNVPIKGNVSGLGKAEHDEFIMASGEMSAEEYKKFLAQSLGYMKVYSKNGSIHFICIDWRHIAELLAAGIKVCFELKNICIWNKTNGGMGTLYRSKHEMVAVFKSGTGAHINNVALGKYGRNRTNVWDYPGQSSMHAGREEELQMHPTVKPVALVADALLDCSHRKGIVLDPFGGSGTTLMAAERTGRIARLLEIEPRYVDITIRRWQKQAGKDAVHAVTGEFFNALSKNNAKKEETYV